MSLEEGVIRQIVREELEAEISKRNPKKPKIIIKTMTDADTEYNIALPARTKKFTMHMRETDTDFRLAFEKGRVAEPKGDYFTVHDGTPYWEENLDLQPIFKIFVACAIAGKTLEVIAWS